MTNPSPLVNINSQSQLPNGVNVTAGSTATVALASAQGVFAWSLECVGTDDLNDAVAVNATLVVNSANYTATFTVPSLVDGYGCALIFKSVVNSGQDINGLVQPYLSTTFGVYVPSVGLRLGAQNETTEGNVVYGWLTKFNDAVRGGAFSGGLLFGDVTGASAMNTVSYLQGHALSVSSTPTTNYVLTWNGSAWVAEAAQGGTLNGDVTGPSSSNTVINIHGASVPAAGSLTPGNTLQVSGSNSLTYAPIALNGGSAVVTGALPTINQVNQQLVLTGDAVSSGGTTGGATTSVVGIRGGLIPALPVSDGYLNYTGSAWQFSAITIPTSLPPSGAAGGDLSGTYPNPTVAKINATSVPATPSANQVLVATSGTVATWEQISNAQVSSSAAIAVSKLAAGTSAQVLLNNSTPTPTWTSVTGDFTLSNTGVSENIGLLSHALPSLADGYLNWTGSAWQFSAITSLPPSGPAGGALSGTYPNPTIVNLPVADLAAGTSAQILLNSATPTPTWTTVSGDATISSTGSVKVTGIDGYAVPTPSGSSTVLTYNSGSLSWGAGGGGGVTWANDLAGSTNTAQYVAAISGNAGAGGTIPVNSGFLSWGSTQIAVGITQTTLTSSGSGHNLQVAAQTNNGSGNGGNLLLSAGVGNISSSNAAAVIITGLQLQLQLGSAGAPGLNMTFTDSALAFNNTSGTPLFSQTALSSTSSGSGSAGQNFTIDAQAGQAATGAAHNGGNGGELILNTGPGGTSGSASAGTAGSLLLQTGGTTQVTVTPTTVTLAALGGSGAGYVAVSNTGLLSWVAGAAPTGTAGGDLSGTYPNPTVAKINGTALDASVATVGAAQDGYALTWHNASSSWKPLAESGGGGGSGITALTGDVTASGTGSVAATIATMQATNTVTKTSNYTINSGSPLDFQILANPSGAFNLTLPAPANGMVFHVWDISGTMETNNVTLVRHGSEKISGVAASRALQTNWGHWMITSNGSDWFISG